jgi:hypothetical protein
VSLLLGAFVLTGVGRAGSLVWLQSLESARAAALTDGRLILLMAGRLTCPSCAYVKNESCEAPSVRPILEEAHVPWFADLDHAIDWQPYKAGLSSYALPLVCVIDPHTTNAWLARRTGLCAAVTLEAFLREALRAYPPQPNNLVDQQVVRVADYEVRGRIWTNAQPTGVFYRVTQGTPAADPFVRAVGTTEWQAALAPYLVLGMSNAYAFEVYAEYASSTPGSTNRLVFHYDPSGTPCPAPQIVSVGVSHQLVHLTLANLTPGVVIELERSRDVGPRNQWILVTNFISGASTSQIVEATDPAWGQAFYRVLQHDPPGGRVLGRPSGDPPLTPSLP